ncbi:MAG: 50S ribosomal protein L23 [Desulfovibrio sp.]|nr:50S ribosomal protein L23 [Desulfovibrio sp.]
MNLNDVLLRPLLTEKTTMLKDEARQVTFMVAPGANQLQIEKAVEQTFNVKVQKVNIVRRRPRRRFRQGRLIGQQSGWKKAYVMLAPGDKIDLFEGV